MNAVLEEAVGVKGIASVLRCSTDKVYRMVKATPPEIPYFKVGREYRFHPSSVLAKLTAPAPSWQQSKRSLARRRAA